MSKYDKIVIGIVSWFPDKEPMRQQRIDRLNRLVKQCDEIFPQVSLMFIAQNWKDYVLPVTNSWVRAFKYNKLGIVGARKKLGEHFIESQFDYLIMFDDDAIIKLTEPCGGILYLEEILKHPDSFCFLQYKASQLSGCAISKYIYSQEPMVNVCAENSEAYEDTVWSNLLHYKFNDREFNCNTIECVHFNNPNEVAGSTWADNTKKWKQLEHNTYTIVDYIAEHKELPNIKVFLEFNELVDISYTYEQYIKDKNQKLVDSIIDKLPNEIKDKMRDVFEDVYGLK